ncbi:MAG: ABC transporter permease [Anaerolineaceae bacterium]|nr:MAG: ABC transporter permease [Anaerolineaceae bacterium]
MISTKEKVINNLNIVWSIASKDIVDALKNKATVFNIFAMIAIVVFFYWISSVRPFDKEIEVVVYDEGNSSLPMERVQLADGYSLVLYEMSSIQQMERNMGFKELGLVIPADFDQVLNAVGEPVLQGSILWVHRAKATELESKYSQKLSEWLGQSVRVEIGDNFVVPQPDIPTWPVHFHILFAVFFMAISTVPHLMLEEQRTKTMDALLVSPASAGQVVVGKALAGLFYVLLSGGLFFALNWAYVTHWGLALLAFLCTALFSIGVALILGVFIKNPFQMMVSMAPMIFLLVLPAFFALQPNLTANLKTILGWLPTTALVKIVKLSLSSEVPLDQLLNNLAIALGSTAVVYAVVIWKARRSDR